MKKEKGREKCNVAQADRIHWGPVVCDFCLTCPAVCVQSRATATIHGQAEMGGATDTLMHAHTCTHTHTVLPQTTKPGSEAAPSIPCIIPMRNSRSDCEARKSSQESAVKHPEHKESAVLSPGGIVVLE